MKIYISGKISGLSIFTAAGTFLEGAKECRILYPNAKIINPIEIQHDQNLKWDDYMLKDIEELFTCDAIYMLSNWRQSVGARIEFNIAKEMKKKIHYQPKKKKK